MEFCERNNISVVTIETMRDIEMQKHYLQIGASATLHSMHLPQPPNGLSLAFDIAPLAYLHIKLWNPNGALWLKIAEFSKSIGLEPGAYWKRFIDNPHHQLSVCQCSIANLKATT